MVTPGMPRLTPSGNRGRSCVRADQRCGACLAPSPPAPLPLIVVRAALPRRIVVPAVARIVGLGATPARIAIGGVEALRNRDFGPAAHREAALRLIVEHHDELGPIVGL